MFADVNRQPAGRAASVTWTPASTTAAAMNRDDTPAHR